MTTNRFPKLERLTLTSGDVLEVSDGVTAIVGPNNVGKSVLLAELQRWLSMPQGSAMLPPAILLAGAEFGETPSIAGFQAWLKSLYVYRPPGSYPNGQYLDSHYVFPNNNVLLENQIGIFLNSQGRFSSLASIYALYLPPGASRDMANGTNTYNTFTEQPSNPVQHLFSDRELERELSSLTQRAFGLTLTVNRYGGSQITVHFGTVSSPEMPPPAPKEYIQEIMALPQVQQQGDGVKAFVGMMLAIFTTSYSLLIIDEPETFLHPPQAYLLGQLLAEQHDRETQVLVATHSVDVIRGMTSARAARGTVSIARLTRNDTVNRFSQVSTTALRDLFEDPLIRYYSILDGLFFQGVALCEADSDCTYYRAVLDFLETSDQADSASVDLHFTHCGGKARLAKAVTALRSASVPVACIVDFDFLQNEHEFNEVVAACGGGPTALLGWRNNVVSSIEARNSRVRRSAAEQDINRIIRGRDTDELSSAELRRLSEALKARSGWREAKLAGRSLLSGEASSSFDSLNAALHQLGIYVVEIGELERFHPDVPASNKAEWLRIVLEERRYEQSAEARAFIRAVGACILARQ